MSYRFLKITLFYPEFLKSYYQNNSTIVHISYSEQYDDLMTMKYGCSNAFQTGLNELGNEGYEIVSNVYPLQKMWAVENGVSPDDKFLLLKQIKAISPDIILLQNSLAFTPEYIYTIGDKVSSV